MRPEVSRVVIERGGTWTLGWGTPEPCSLHRAAALGQELSSWLSSSVLLTSPPLPSLRPGAKATPPSGSLHRYLVSLESQSLSWCLGKGLPSLASASCSVKRCLRLQDFPVRLPGLPISSLPIAQASRAFCAGSLPSSAGQKWG